MIPKMPKRFNNLGFALYQNGNYRAAVDRLKRAAKIAPNDERVLNNLGLAFAGLENSMMPIRVLREQMAHSSEI